MSKTDFIFNPSEFISPEEMAIRSERAELRIKEAQAIKMENDALKSETSREATLFRLEVSKGKYIEIAKHKNELLFLTNTFIKTLDSMVDKVIIVVNNNLEGGVSNIQAESITRDLRAVINKIKLELAGEKA
jgi:hypothetical protein